MIVECISVHYFNLNMTCAYEGKDGGCDGPVSVIRISQFTDGSLRVSTMCHKHHTKEKEHFIENDGFELAGETNLANFVSDSVLYHPEVHRQIVEAVAKSARDGRFEAVTKYAVATICDQTICYVTEDDCHTTKHPEAKLWTSVKDASAKASELSVDQSIFLKNGGRPESPLDIPDDRIKSMSMHWVEDVIDEEEFRSREDTW